MLITTANKRITIPQRLLMFDYDGIVCVPQPESFSIMREALRKTFVDIAKINAEIFDHLDWPKIFNTTKGTAEKNLFLSVAKELRLLKNIAAEEIKEELITGLYNLFVAQRAALIQQFNHQREQKSFDETVLFGDFLTLIEKIQADQSIETIICLTTGNPSGILNDRVPEFLRNHVFNFMVGGDRGITRANLIEQSIAEAREKSGFVPVYDCEKRMINAFYVDDSDRGIVSSLETGVRSVYVPRSSLKDVDWGIDLGKDLYPLLVEKYGPTLATQLFIGERSRVSQSVFCTSLLSNEFLFGMPENSEYQGFLDPRAHILREKHLFVEGEESRLRRFQES